MLSAIVRFALRLRGVIIALAALGIGYGVYSVVTAKYDVFPEFAPLRVDIQTEAPGLSAEQVELLVTQPIENSLNGARGVQSIRSQSVQGLSLVVVIFESSTDVYHDRQVVAERLARLSGSLPTGAKAPAMTPLISSTGTMVVIGMTSEKLSLMQIRTIADWVIVPRLLAVPGVTRTAVYGGEVRQIQIQIDPAKLIAHELSIDDLLNAARRATGVRGAGFIDTRNQRIIIRSEGQSLTPADIASVVVAHQPTGNVLIGDVAQVVNGAAPPISDASIDGRRGVIVNVNAQYGANTRDTTVGAERALADLMPLLRSDGIVVHPALFRAANFIDLATHNIDVALLLGAILVMVVLFLFLSSFRSAAISCTAIPLSLLTALVVLQRLGYTLNIMTLGGLAIAIGEVVDDAVIDVENIQRRLRANRDRPRLEVIFDASLEVRGAVVYATFAVTLVFIPIMTMGGVAGRLFSPMALAYIFSILASLLVALTVTPALCTFLLHGPVLDREERPWLTRFKSRYRALLLQVERYPGEVIGAVVFATIVGLALFPLLDRTFLPELHENHYIVHMEAAPGTSIAESTRIGAIVQRALLQLPFVRIVGQRVGRAEADEIYGPQSSEIEVDLKPNPPSDALDRIRKTLAAVPGPAFSVNTFLTERIEETISGYAAPVVVELVGFDLDTLDAKAQEVARVLAGVPGATDIQMQSPPGTPQVEVRLRPADVARWGFNPVDVLDSLRVAYSGNVVGEVFEGNRVFDVSVILPPAQRNAVDSIANLPLRSPSGTYVRLRDVADVVQGSGRYVILHEAARRVQTVTCNVAGGNFGSFVDRAQRAIAAKVSLPSNMYVEFTGSAQEEARSRRDLLVHSSIVLVAIGLLLYVVMRNFRNLGLVALNLPFALVGGVVAALIVGEPLSVGSMVGFVTLFGITLRNSIMMISHYEHLVTVEGQTWNVETSLRGASERLVPIVMTSLVTALGLLPLAIGRNAPGREIEGAMAVVILGGLFTSTALNLLVLPTLAHRYGKFRDPATAEAPEAC